MAGDVADAEAEASAPRASVWKNANFQRLWIGESLSQLGENLGTLAIPVFSPLRTMRKLPDQVPED